MFIRSERLFLRPLWPEERAELHGLIDAAALDGRPHAELEPGDVDETRTASRLDASVELLITLPSGDRGAPIIGAIRLALANKPELHGWIAPAYRGRGYDLEATAAVISLSRALGHGDPVVCGDPEGPAIRRTMVTSPERAGNEIAKDLAPSKPALRKRRMAA